MPSVLADLVHERVLASLATTISRTVEKVAEELAEDLLRDPAFRTDIRELARAAFTQALQELRNPATPP